MNQLFSPKFNGDSFVFEAWFYKRFRLFIMYSMKVSDRPIFLIVPERLMFLTVSDVFWSQMVENVHKTFKDGERWTVSNA